jgi:antitoxin (DNA-binding transcriptional repressor) of toxin-antitoxin stability system
MKTVMIEELDPKTGQWLREASQHDQVMVMDQGKPIITLHGTQPTATKRMRQLLPEFAAIMNKPIGGADITRILAEDREDRL